MPPCPLFRQKYLGQIVLVELSSQFWVHWPTQSSMYSVLGCTEVKAHKILRSWTKHFSFKSFPTKREKATLIAYMQHKTLQNKDPMHISLYFLIAPKEQSWSLAFWKAINIHSFYELNLLCCWFGLSLLILLIHKSIQSHFPPKKTNFMTRIFYYM